MILDDEKLLKAGKSHEQLVTGTVCLTTNCLFGVPADENLEAGRLFSTQMYVLVFYRAFQQLEVLYYEPSLAVVMPYQYQMLDHMVEPNFLRQEAMDNEYRLKAVRPQLYDLVVQQEPPQFRDNDGLTAARPHAYQEYDVVELNPPQVEVLDDEQLLEIGRHGLR